MKSNLTLFRIIAVSLVILSCNKNKNALESSENEESMPADSMNYITVSKDQFAAAGMELGGIQTYEYAESVTASGYIDVPPDNRAKIGTFMGGYVKSANLLPGDHVRKGQILITLENIEYLKLQQSFLETKEQLEYLKSVYESQKTLADEKISSQRNYMQAKSDYNSMLAAYESLSRQLQLLQIDPLTVKAETMVSIINLTSPIMGYITKANAVKGMFVNPSDILYEIIDPSHLHIELKVFEKDLFRLRIGQSVVFRIPEAAGVSCKGEIILIGREIDGDERTVPVHGHIVGKPEVKLTPGMYIEAVIHANVRPAEGLPVDALVPAEGRNFVYIKNSESDGKYIFERIPVRIGTSNEDWFEVHDSSGILHKADNNILIKGGFYLTQE